jgi:hypothetical protein
VSCLRENLTSSSYGEGLETDRENSIPRQSFTRQNRIKEQYSLFAGRVSAATMRANQLRLYLSAAAYLLLSAFRRLALVGTAWARAQCKTIRLQLLRIGAQVRVTVRKVWISIASSYPHWHVFALAHQQLRC